MADFTTGRPARVLIMGAAGRDFHNFNIALRDNAHYRVAAFTAAQIPNIADRRYPPALAGTLYPDGIPIVSEDQLDALITREAIDQVLFSYSDIAHERVMHIASRVLALGADFRLLGGRATQLRSRLPVVAITAVRTGCGKSPAARRVAAILHDAGLRVGILRHPMAYGDLAAQAVQRFATLDDLAHEHCTLEEREEYEPHIRAGHVVFAGVDYARVLERAEREADVLIWDGGNNDLPLLAPDVDIVLVDPHRAGHEHAYFPGEANLLRAQVIVIPKVDSAEPAQLAALRASVHAANPAATVTEAAMPISADHPERIRNARVLVVEDGPTLTHGGMAYGAGTLLARQLGARELVDPRPYAVGSIGDVFARYPHIGPVLPALGYGTAQIAELEATIRAVPCDAVLVASPIDLRRVMTIAQPVCRASYELRETTQPDLSAVLQGVIAAAGRATTT